MKEYKIYGVRQYSTYVWANNKKEAMRLSEGIPLEEWEPNEAEGEEIHPREVCKV